jgi:hypothetical protein
VERERLRRGGFAALCVLAAAATAVAMVRILAPGGAVAREGASCSPPANTFAAVRDRFVATAVLRVDTVCSYALVTQEFRQGMTREAWAAGTIPVIPFHTKLPGRTRVETLPRDADAGQRASLVLLSSPDIGDYAYEVVLVRRGGRWLVTYWNAAPPGASAPSVRDSP